MKFKLSKKQRKIVTLLGVGVVLAGVISWYMLTRTGTTQAQVVAMPATRGTIEVKVSGTGAVEPADTSNVTSKVGGTIAKIDVKDGQTVKRGQVLFELDSSDVQNQIDKAQLDLRQSQLQLGLTDQELNSQEARATISGQVYGIQVTEGQDVQNGARLMTIRDTSSMVAKVPFNDVSNITVGQQADVILPGFSGLELSGRVDKVDRGGRVGSDNARSYQVSIKFPSPGALAPGTAVQASVHTAKGIQTGTGMGTVDWADTQVIRAGMSGTVQTVPVDENQYVKKGQLLATLSSDSLNLQSQTQSLQISQARLNIESLQKQLADYIVYAPADGVVTLTEKSASSSSSSSSTSTSSSGQSGEWQVGDDIKAGELLATINNTSGMVVTVPVDEVDIAKVKTGQKASITFDALPDQTFTGYVSEIASEGTVSNNVASFDVTVTLDPADSLKVLKEGMTANVEILINRKENVITVPIEAVQERQGRKFVIVENDNSGDNSGGNSGSGFRSNSGNSYGNNYGSSSGSNSGQRNNVRNMLGGTPRPVETGLYNESYIEITKGLNEGDMVVLPTVGRSTGANNAGANREFGMGGFGGGPRIYTGGGGGSGGRNFSGGGGGGNHSD